MTSTIKAHLNRFSLAGMVLLAASTANGQAISLDQAVNNQLQVTTGGLGCSVLLANGANVTGALQDICARAVPAGATPSSAGGGSATPAAGPGANITFAKQADKEAEDIAKNKASSGGNWGLFITAENESLERDASEFEGGFDADTNRFVMGIVYAPSTTAAYSFGLDLNSQDGDFNVGGDFSHDSTGYRFLASFNPSDKLSFQVAAAYDDISADRRRIARFTDIFNDAEFFVFSGTPDASYDYDQLGLNALLGYELSSGQFSLTSQFGLNWLSTDYGTYDERGDSGLELTFHNDDRKSFQGSIGLLGTYAVGTSYGAFIPQFNATWRHEFENDARDVSVSFVQDLNSVEFTYQTEAFDSDFIDLSAGGVFVFANGFQAFANVQTLLAHEYFSSVIVSAGLRWEL